MKRILLAVFVAAVLGAGQAFADYVSPYDESFALLNKTHIVLLTNSLESRDYNLVYSAIKRLGQLQVTNTLPRIEVWFRESNPAANPGRDLDIAAMRNVFNISVWAIGRMGGDHDAEVLSYYLDKITDVEAQIAIIDALGDLSDSQNALDALHKEAQTVTDQRIADRVVKAIMKHNMKASYEPLMNMANRGGVFNQGFRDSVKQNAVKLLTSGR